MYRPRFSEIWGRKSWQEGPGKSFLKLFCVLLKYIEIKKWKCVEMTGNIEKLTMVAFYKYGVKAIWFMFAVLKRNWVVLFLHWGGGEFKKFMNTQENAAYQLHILNCINESFLGYRKIIISSPNCFYAKLMQLEFMEGENNLPYTLLLETMLSVC